MIGRVRESRNPKKVIRVTLMESYGEIGREPVNLYNIIKAVSLGDAGALLDSANDIKNLVFHAPTVLFWDKMQRYMFGTFRDYREQVKMAEKFCLDNGDYEKFVKKQIHLINEINDDKKVIFFCTAYKMLFANRYGRRFVLQTCEISNNVYT